jgi:hypothetical protein
MKTEHDEKLKFFTLSAKQTSVDDHKKLSDNITSRELKVKKTPA